MGNGWKQPARMGFILVFMCVGFIYADEFSDNNGCQSYSTEFGECKRDSNGQLDCDFSNSISYPSCYEGPLVKLKEGKCNKEGLRCWKYTNVTFTPYSRCHRGRRADHRAWIASCKPVSAEKIPDDDHLDKIFR
jgi:hypothetical protein